jgi:hypothetical protein
VQNSYPDQPLRVTIDALPSLAPFGDSRNLPLLEPGRELNRNTSGSGPLGSPVRQTEGLSFELASEAGGFHVEGTNRSSNPSGWGCAEIVLDAPLDLREHRALATWVEGYGSAAYLHFVLEDAGRWSVRDYYVRLDFKGRRYVELREAAKGEVYDFAFPFNNYWAIRDIDFRAISRVYVFLTGVPAYGVVEARFGSLEALREEARPVENAKLTINGTTAVFPVRLKTGWYLEYSSSGTRVFDANGFEQQMVGLHAASPLIRKGGNEISFGCDRCSPVKITIVTRGAALR